MIHQYKLGDLCVVLDVCSGSVHAVDEVAYDMIAGFETQERETLVDALAEKYRDREDVTRPELEECYDQLLALKDAGKLFTEDTFAPMAGELKARTSGVIKALCLHVAHTCNLNCSYCFASQGKYHGDRALMSYEVGKQALDFLMDHSGTRHNLEVDFFGGEPLMNFDVGKRLGGRARRRGWRTQRGEGAGQALPLYPDHQWGAHRRRRHRLCQPGDEQCGAESGRPQGGP